jgi:hypothetical protein
VNYKIVLFLFLIISCCSLSYSESDTVSLFQKTESIYLLNSSIDSSTISVICFPDTQNYTWSFSHLLNRLTFLPPLDSGITVYVNYKKNYVHFPQTYSLYKKKYYSDKDTAVTLSPVGLKMLNKSDNLSISGFKSFSVSADNVGQINLEQGLDVRIGGTIRPGTELSAHLNDQGSTLEGATKEISDFDMIFIELKDKNFNIIAGDQYVKWIDRAIITNDKKIKGISADIHNENVGFKVFGAISSGKYAIQTIRGQSGIQGPYFLKGNGENSIIVPISGTIHCSVNARELRENDDYSVNYELGTIHFTSRTPIQQYDLIKIDYEYKLYDYQRTVAGLNAFFSSKDSLIQIKSALWTESDNKEHPIDVTLTDIERDLLEQSGDSLPLASTAILVDPKDVAAKSALYPLYTKKTGLSGETFFEYTPYNPLRPNVVSGFYFVWFNDFGTNKGDYIRKVSSFNEYYLYVGPNRGNFSPLKTLPAPRRSISGEINAVINNQYITIDTKIAGENYDNNLFSKRNDNDNNAAGIKSNYLFQNDTLSKIPLWLSGSYFFNSDKFSYDVLSRYEKVESWDDSITYQDKANTHFYESSIGVKPLSFLSLESGYGQNRRDSLLITDKIFGNLQLILPSSHIVYKNSLFKHYHFFDQLTSRKQSIATHVLFTNHILGVLLKEEWNTFRNTNGNGFVESKVNYSFKPLSLDESFSITSFRTGNNQFSASDTGYLFTWNQRINYPIFDWWSINGNSTYSKKQIDNNFDQQTLLVNLKNSFSKNSFELIQKYGINFEKASAFVQVPVYAGRGLGNYMYDSILRIFVLHTPGDYFLQQQEVFDSLSNSRIKKTNFEINWSYKPSKKIKGILNDLEWQGFLFIEEHLDAENKIFKSWIPGFTTLSNAGKKDILFTLSNYADLFYRQDIFWYPNRKSNINGSFFIIPSLKKNLDYIEFSLNSGLKINYSNNNFYFSDETKYMYTNHSDSNGLILQFRDGNTTLTEKFTIYKEWSIYAKQSPGFLSQSYNKSADQKTFDFDSSFYFQIGPGILWEPVKYGLIDMSYTYSKVPETSNLDYRIANGFKAGKSHVFSVLINFKASKNVLINGSYRGEISEFKTDKINTHVFSLEGKVLF